MWCAMGQCYESDQLQMTVAAIRCYQRAHQNGDQEGIALGKLAKLHHEANNAKAAAHYHRLNLVRLLEEGADDSDSGSEECVLGGGGRRGASWQERGQAS